MPLVCMEAVEEDGDMDGTGAMVVSKRYSGMVATGLWMMREILEDSKLPVWCTGKEKLKATG